jgi:hypothetical protein
MSTKNMPLDQCLNPTGYRRYEINMPLGKLSNQEELCVRSAVDVSEALRSTFCVSRDPFTAIIRIAMDKQKLSK